MSAINCKGFTAIELLIIIAICGILAAIFLPVMLGNSVFEATRCIGGYKHTYGGYYEGPRQIFDENNRAIPCNKGNSK